MRGDGRDRLTLERLGKNDATLAAENKSFAIERNEGKIRCAQSRTFSPVELRAEEKNSDA